MAKWKECGKFAQSFIPRWGMYLACVLEEGHEGECLPGGTCVRHGFYARIGGCPHWPTCIRKFTEEKAMTKEQKVKVKHLDANAKWNDGVCRIVDGRGHTLGATKADFPYRSYQEIEEAAWVDAAQNIVDFATE